MPPTWLPDLHVLTGIEDADMASLWGVFYADFVTGHPRVEGWNVAWDKQPLPGTVYHRGFVHLITRDSEMAGGRRLDDFRAERLPWCRAMFNNCTCTSILKWDYREGSGRIHTYIWLQDEDYVVVLWRKNAGYFALVTAYHVDGPSTRKKLHSKYRNRE